MKQQRPLALVGFFVASFSAAAIGGAATATSVGTWYRALNKPAWNPPDWIFGPVWTVLYVLMAVAAWRVWCRTDGHVRRHILVLFGTQLGLNALWSGLFFGLRQPGAALVDVLVLWSLLLGLQVRFARIDRVAGGLWAPYLAWVSFASVLNASVWWLNR
jgi:translocator protein